MKKLLFLFVLSLSLYSFSLNLNFNIGLTYNSTITDDIEFNLYHKTKKFDFVIDISFLNDNKYIFHEKNFYFGHYFLNNNDYIAYKNNNIKITAGIKDLEDEVDSPYSLFFSSKNISKPIFELDYNDELFFFKSRWIQLNKNSSQGYKDRGLDYKVYGIKLNDFKVGFQNIVLYDNRDFDYFYLFNPLPAYFTQEIRSSGNSMPWTENLNDNSIMGFFGSYNNKCLYSYLQILVDDFNMNRFFNPNGKQNPDKIAWSFGSVFSNDYGNFYFYNAGATKYTFNPYSSHSGYTLYPSDIYNDNHIIDYKDNYIGYYYGENSLSFLFGYKGNLNDYELSTSLEFVVSGSKSPNNPWGIISDNTVPTGTHFLDDSTLEKTFTYTSTISKKVFNTNLFLSFKYINTMNELKYDSTKKIFESIKGNDNTKFEISSYIKLQF
ncbi:hypothetical protein OSSY52_12820 [Tepiditoga spiralis]|uniref:Uncharacterized protein n=1 Tax=Tepiditoga spiralis TaxID=2108365 RepID=A0A7G1G467_9BACT|nr:hypothetical protein [Tepiditoga spiralis]BBE31141.1 hypothetical protein OSSY52_12820 [Tepiditoga spiralis]